METAATIGLLQFGLDGHLYALLLDQVERVVRAVELRELPGAPSVIRGIFSLHGEIVPVADPRRRIGLPDEEISLEDRIIIAHTPARILGLLIHGDVEVTHCDRRDIIATESVVSGAILVDGVGRLPDGLVLIQNLAKFLSIDEEVRLEDAIHARA